MRLFALILMLAAPLAHPAAAGPDRLSFLMGSKHIDAQSDFEEINPGLVLTWEPRLTYSVAAYRNSYGRGSVAFSLGYPVFTRKDMQIEVFGALAYYPIDGRRFAVHWGDVIPLGGLQARYKNVFMQAIPSDGIEADAIFSFGLTFALGSEGDG